MGVIINVEFSNGTHAHFHVGPESIYKSWRTDPVDRHLVIGHGLPRLHIPLDNVRLFSLEEEGE